MPDKRSKDDESESSAPSSFKKLKTKEDGSSMYAPEPVKPEWLELPAELEHYSKSSSSDSAPPSAAWNKYYPYDKSRHLPLSPLNHPPTFTPESPALCFQVHGICGRARACTLHFPNGGPPVPTPRFMPVGTKGTLKGVVPSEITEMNCPIILANTYHLAIQPGTDLIDEVFGGLPKFMGSILPNHGNSTGDDKSTTSESSPPKRRFNLLTDSGGFQMVSLAALSQVTEQGVLFESPYTGKPMLLKPEDSIRCQNQIGADIIMQLDDVVSSVATDDKRFRIATFRTLRWYDRCVEAHQFPLKQNLFPIVQGALDTSPGGLRELCLAGFKHRDEQASQQHQKSKQEASINNKLQQRIPGFAIGGLAGGESKDDFWRVVDHACRHLPDDRPRYLMGVGYPLDLVVCTALGVDQYDCVYPTRTARFGVALSDGGLLKLKQHEFVFDNRVIEEGCPCQACSRGVSRKRLHMLLKSGKTSVAIQLLTQHNVCYMMGLVNRMRQAILDQRYPDFCREFLAAQFPNPLDIPSWVVDALRAAGITIDTTGTSRNLDFLKTVDELRQNASFDPTEKKDLRNELKREWDAVFQELDEIQATANKEKLDKWFDRLYQQHNEAGRYYHTAVHLMEMLRYWNTVVAQDLSLSSHSPAICLATFFHDAIYDPKSSINEEDSAELFKEFCVDALKSQPATNDSNKDNHVAQVTSMVVTLIIATKKHEIIINEEISETEKRLQKVFLDIDMSVLGKHENAYLAYAGCIRNEYSFVEKPVYCEKRAEILTGFLENKNQIFLSDLFHQTLEAQARSNLTREIELLRQGSIPGK